MKLLRAEVEHAQQSWWEDSFEKLNSKVIVNLPGGQLTVCWDLSSSVIMKGPTQTVYEGTIEI